MSRFFNLLAFVAMIGSAIAAYSVKYETILVTEKLKKREGELQREKDAITILSAEWQLLNRPARLQSLAPPESGMQALSVKQLAHAGDVPQAKPDAEKSALDGLLTGGLPEPARKPQPNTPDAGSPRAAVTPASKTGISRSSLKSALSGPAAAMRASGVPMALSPQPAAKRDAIAQVLVTPAPSAKAAGLAPLRPPLPIGTAKSAPAPRKAVAPQ